VKLRKSKLEINSGGNTKATAAETQAKVNLVAPPVAAVKPITYINITFV